MAIPNENRSTLHKEKERETQDLMLWLERFVGQKLSEALRLSFEPLEKGFELEEPEWSDAAVPARTMDGLIKLHSGGKGSVGVLRFPQLGPKENEIGAGALARPEHFRALQAYVTYIKSGKQLGMTRHYLDVAIRKHI